MRGRSHTPGVNVNSTRSEVNNSPDWNGAGKVNKPSVFAAQTPSSGMDEPPSDPQVGPSELYDQLMDFCEQGGFEIDDVLTALMLALRDFAIDHYGSKRHTKRAFPRSMKRLVGPKLGSPIRRCNSV